MPPNWANTWPRGSRLPWRRSASAQGDAKALRSLSVDVARYAQQAVLMANVEEARYRVLLSKEGKTLVQALYAIRNNQRNFLKVTLPAGAAIWSAWLFRPACSSGTGA